jgi:hypothetical protein
MRAVNGPAKAGLYVLLGCLTAVPGVAHAQTAWRDHARVSINAGIQLPASRMFTATTTTTVYLEPATVNTAYQVPRGAFFDGGGLIRVRRAFGVGVAVSAFSGSQTADVAGSIPHPFFFNTPRALSGTTSPLERSETAVHIQAAYVIASKRVNVAIAGGPTFFNVSQDLVADAAYTDPYPHDAVTFTSATTSKVSESKLGFNAGVDIGVKLSKSFGVGGLVRFSRASVTFPLANTASGVSVDVGGLQAGGGVRFFF